jgi:hypothetical protein
MTRNSAGSFFARMRWKLFKLHISREIHDRIFPHLRQELDNGYPFQTQEQMNAQTEELDVQALFDTIEGQIRNMPKAYGTSFRYIMHCDLHERLRMYEQVARLAVHPKTCDPRLIATCYEPSH